MSNQARTPSLQDLPVLKNKFPFRLGTTSFILPADVLPNVRALARHVDEIELILFESTSGPLQPDVIRELKRIAMDQELTYNVHLPLDLYLGDGDQSTREQGRKNALMFYENMLAIEPTTFVLHLDWGRPDQTTPRHDERDAWLERLRESLCFLLEKGVEAQSIAVENLNYPLSWVAPLVDTLGMRFCLDIGHVLVQGYDLAEHFSLYGSRTTMLHVHGVREGKDHQSLAYLEQGAWQTLLEFLKMYKHGVSVEVFSLEKFTSSIDKLKELERICRT